MISDLHAVESVGMETISGFNQVEPQNDLKVGFEVLSDQFLLEVVSPSLSNTFYTKRLIISSCQFASSLTRHAETFPESLKRRY